MVGRRRDHELGAQGRLPEVAEPARWVRAESGRGSDLGPWLDRVRQQTLLGTDTAADVDEDDAALAAYNARLAALHGIAPPEPGARRHSD